jgi:hypothetical protein
MVGFVRSKGVAPECDADETLSISIAAKQQA